VCAAVHSHRQSPKMRKFFLKSQQNSRTAAVQGAVTRGAEGAAATGAHRIATPPPLPHRLAASHTAAAAVGSVSRRLLRCNHRLCVWSSMCVFKRMCMLTSIDRLVCLLLGDLPCRDSLFSPRLVKMSRFNFKIVLLGEGRVGKTSLVLR
jgi:hypothetical protein